jgi:AcrR family transcriptional regulator
VTEYSAVVARLEARTRILDATRNLLTQRSAQFFKVRDIAAMAQVSPALVMRYFKSKDELVFQAAMALWNETGTPELLAWVEQQTNLTSQAFILKLLETDLGNGHRARDLMTMAWWWSSVEEEVFQAALAPRARALMGLLLSEHGLPPTLRDASLNRLLRAYGLMYVDTLRRAGVLRRTPADAAAEYENLIAPINAAFKARAAELKG